MSQANQSASLIRAIQFFESLTPTSVGQIESLYAENTYFKDPFNEVQGALAVKAIFAHMFVKVDQPRFKIIATLEQGQEAFLTWDFLLQFKGETVERKVHGSSHLRFNPEGKIVYHRDYWDTAEELYEKLPFVGGFMRFLKKRAKQ